MKILNTGDKVKITKQGMFNGSTGTITAVKYDIDLGALGIWSFPAKDIEGLIKTEAPNKPVNDIKNLEWVDSSPNELNPVKTPKTKAIKKKVVKTKRPYNKKVVNDPK